MAGKATEAVALLAGADKAWKGFWGNVNRILDYGVAVVRESPEIVKAEVVRAVAEKVAKSSEPLRRAEERLEEKIQTAEKPSKAGFFAGLEMMVQAGRNWLKEKAFGMRLTSDKIKTGVNERIAGVYEGGPDPVPERMKPRVEFPNLKDVGEKEVEVKKQIDETAEKQAKLDLYLYQKRSNAAVLGWHTRKYRGKKTVSEHHEDDDYQDLKKILASQLENFTKKLGLEEEDLKKPKS